MLYDPPMKKWASSNVHGHKEYAYQSALAKPGVVPFTA